MGVRSCRAGTGYCLLGLDCTLDEDFLPDDEGGHCDGLRSAFTPSAHFICCRYNPANGTVLAETAPPPTPVSMGEDIGEGGLGPLGDYLNTDTEDPESDESNLVQGVEATAGGVAASDGRTEPSQAYWPPLPSNGSSETDDSIAAAVETVTDAAYEEVSVAETTYFGGSFTTYATDTSEHTHMSVPSDDSDTAPTEEETAWTSATETSVIDFAAPEQERSTDTAPGVNAFCDSGATDSSVGGGLGAASSSGGRSQLTPARPVQSRVGFGGPLMIIQTDRGVLEARPSVITAETEILIHGDDVRHRTVEVQTRDFAPINAAAQTAYQENELQLSGNFETWPTDGAGSVVDALSQRDTTTEAYPAVTGSATDSEEAGTAFVEDVMTPLPAMSEHTDTPSTGTAVSSEDTVLLQDLSLNSVIGGNEFSEPQRTWNSDLAAELDNSPSYRATETSVSAGSRREDTEDTDSGSVSTDDRQEQSTVTDSSGHLLTQILHEDGLKLASSTPNTTSAHSQPEKSVSEMSRNSLTISDGSTEIPVAILTEISVADIMTTASGQTMTPSWEYGETEVEDGAQTVPEPCLQEGESVPVSREPEDPGDCDGTAVSPETGPTRTTGNSAEPQEAPVVSVEPSAEGADSESGAPTEHVSTQATALLSDTGTSASAEETPAGGTGGGAHGESQQDSEIEVTPEGRSTPVVPAMVHTVANSSSATATETSDPAGPTVVTAPQHSPLCGVAPPGSAPATRCWLVQFMDANSSSPLCVGSYLNTNTIITSAKCISRSEDFPSAHSVQFCRCFALGPTFSLQRLSRSSIVRRQPGVSEEPVPST
jgi:hypothetical protein